VFRRALAVIAATVALAAGCASAGSPGEGAARVAAEVATAEAEVDRNERELARLVAVGGAVDCTRAARLRDNICGLAERICALLDGERPEPDGPQRCAASRTRCKAARERVAAVCKK
jgi:hypothetical protein